MIFLEKSISAADNYVLKKYPVNFYSIVLLSFLMYGILSKFFCDDIFGCANKGEVDNYSIDEIKTCSDFFTLNHNLWQKSLMKFYPCQN